MRCSIALTLFTVAVLATARDTLQAAQTDASSLPIVRAGSPEHHTAPLENVIARVYWQGMKQISAETNSTSFMAVWDMPESHRLEKQTLDKVASAPWRLLHRSLNTNAAGLLRPLLDDILLQPSFLEICQTTNQSCEFTFAIQLDDERAAFWQTNLAAVFESLTGIHPEPAPKNRYGWTLRKHHAPDLISLARAGSWTILDAAEGTNHLFGQIRSQLQHRGAPFSIGSTNDWFEADADFESLSQSFLSQADLPGNLPRLTLSVTGDGANVRTRGRFTFRQPLSLRLPPWNIPTNLIDGAIDSFTALRGFGPELKSLKVWKRLQIGPPPDQACSWALSGFPMQTFFIAPLPDASNAVSRLANHVLEGELPWSSTNGLAGFKKSKAFNGLEWSGLPYIAPFLLSVATNRSDYVLGGFFPLAPVQKLLPAELLREIRAPANLVYYDWELTGPRIKEWLYLGQVLRLVSQRAQLPPDSAAVKWLEALESRLGNCATEITQTDPTELSFRRKSPVGLTAVELQLLADWLESPRFPYGLHSSLPSTNPPSVKRRSPKNASSPGRP